MTEYQLAGLPVLANARLCCGLEFVPPEGGLIAEKGEEFAASLDHLLRHHFEYNPREAALKRWGWRPSIALLAASLDDIKAARRLQ
ncbi:hypothetical protein RM190_22385 [Paracoccus sp. CPCC 101403]|uniref:Uncharacterized protein n=1 Tax=Paracoccus broussonetiae TaxID=3075834 RepID=A0ABU3EK42_9RHOB|nr:hypothetical protein [Paracoccus sp. CPCC 101403]MDT1064622.1 hypothetical protein [Paracoccus sp. CPCC 101403]